MDKVALVMIMFNSSYCPLYLREYVACVSSDPARQRLYSITGCDFIVHGPLNQNCVWTSSFFSVAVPKVWNYLADGFPFVQLPSFLVVNTTTQVELYNVHVFWQLLP